MSWRLNADVAVHLSIAHAASKAATDCPGRSSHSPGHDPQVQYPSPLIPHPLLPCLPLLLALLPLSPLRFPSSLPTPTTFCSPPSLQAPPITLGATSASLNRLAIARAASLLTRESLLTSPSSSQSSTFPLLASAIADLLALPPAAARSAMVLATRATHGAPSREGGRGEGLGADLSGSESEERMAAKHRARAAVATAASRALAPASAAAEAD
ncbi:unnamed protein product [Closterium sp. NIES-54]